MIRAATKADLQPIVDMCRDFIAEGTYDGMITFDHDRMSRICSALIDSEHADILVPDGMNGMIAVVVDHMDLTGQKAAAELFWYVRPGCRGALGWRLAKAAQQWARDREATVMRMAAPDERVGKMLERGGFKRAEIMYQKGID